LTAFHDSTHNSSILDASTANASLSMAPPKPVVSEIDRMYVQIKAEMDARCTALQRSTDTLRDEVRGEFQSRIEDLNQEVADLRSARQPASS
jgi:hypothetical protein